MKLLNVAVIGMGGFAVDHHNTLLQLEEQGLCRVRCTCDPRIEAFTDRWEALRFEERDVRLFSDYRDMLIAYGDELDVVTIPTPVPLHAPMHRAACKRGINVYLEKPPTLDYRELAGMITAEGAAPKLTNVGFNYIVEPPRQALKARLAAGEFGAVREVCIFARWPRGSKYYTRASWAGRLQMDGTLVLDSCMGNAMAHLTHNGLFWAGIDAPEHWATLGAVQAELYRAHPIEGTDTIFVSAETAQGPLVRLAMTHACFGQARDYEEVVCEDATITNFMGYTEELGVYRDFVIRYTDGREELLRLTQFDHLAENFKAYFAYVLGEQPRPVTRLIDSQPFVEVNDLAYLAAGQIATVGSDAFRREHDATRGTVIEINGIDEVMTRFLQQGDFPSAQGLPWAVAGGSATVGDLPRLPAIIAEMAAPSAAAGE